MEKVFSIKIDGTETVIKDTNTINKELSNVEKLLKKIGSDTTSSIAIEKMNLELKKVVDTSKLTAKQIAQLATEFKKMQNDTTKSLQSIDKGVKFPETRRAVKEITSNLVQIGATAVAEGKNAKEAVTQIGNSVAAIAANFGAYGVAISAVLTLVTPLVASFFELSDAEKKAAEEAAILDANYEVLGNSLADAYSELVEINSILVSTTLSAEAKSVAISELADRYGDYISQLILEEAALGNIIPLQERLFQLQLQQATNNANLGKRNELLAKATKLFIELAKIEQNLADAQQRADKDDIHAYTLQLVLQKAKISNLRDEIALQQQANNELLAASDNIFKFQQELDDALKIYDPEAVARQERNAANQRKQAAREAEQAAKQAEDNREKRAKKEADDLQRLRNIRDAELKALKEIATNGDLTKIAEQQQKVANAAAEYDNALGEAIKKNKDLSSASKDVQGDASKKNISEAQKRIADLDVAISDLTDKTVRDSSILENAIATAFSTEDTAVFSDALKGVREEYGSLVDSAIFGKKGGRETAQLFTFPKGKDIEESKQQLFALRKEFTDFDEFIKQAKARGFGVPLLDAVVEKNKKAADILKKSKSDYETTIREEEKRAKGLNLDFKPENIFKESRDIVKKRFNEEGAKAADAVYDGFKIASDLAFQSGNNPFVMAVERLIMENNKALNQFEKTNAQVVENFNKAFGDGLITMFEGDLQFNEEQIAAARAKLNEEEVKAFDDQIATLKRIDEIANVERLNRSAVFQQNLLELADNFTKDFLEQSKKRIRLNLELTDLEYRELKFKAQQYEDEQLGLLKKSISARKARGEKQSEEEINLIEETRDEALRLLELQFRKEDELIRKKGQDNIDLLKARLLDQSLTPEQRAALEAAIDKQQRDIELIRKEAEEKQRKERNATEETFNALIDPKQIEDSVQKIFETFLKYYNIYGERIFGLFTALNDLAISQIQKTIDGLNDELNKTEDRLSQSLSRLNELEGDLEGKRSGRRDAVLRGIQLEQDRQERLTQKKIELERRLAAEELKISRKRKQQALATAIIQGAVSIAQIFATPSLLPSPAAQIVKIAEAAVAGATIAAQIATINNTKFAKGGYTGNGYGKRDETGFKVAGVVHQDEYVIPSWMVKNPQISPTISRLEQIRTKGFADGGFTSTTPQQITNISNSLNTDSLVKTMEWYMQAAIALSNRPIVASPVEFQNVNDKMARKIDATRI